MKTFQDKKSEITFFDNLAIKSEYDAVPEQVYKKVAIRCHRLLQSKPSKILEVGCGSGKFGKALAQLGHKVTGIDISSETVKNANREKPKGFKAKILDMENQKNFPKDSFSLILCPGVLHHLPNLTISQAIPNFRHWLEPGGLVVCWEPNGSNPITALSKILFRLVYLIAGGGEFATVNETNHSFKQYLSSFERNGFRLVSSRPLSDKSTAGFSNPVMRILIEIRWLLYVLIDKLIPPPFSGVMLFMIYRKKSLLSKTYA